MKRVLFVFLSCLFVLVGNQLTYADDFPSKPVVMNVAYSPGGGNDTIARLMAMHIEKYLGARMVVENNPGAGGQVGFTKLANSKNDGYTIGLLSSPSIFMIQETRKDVRYDLDSFAPIINIQSDPIILVVKSDSDINTVNDFIELSQNSAKKLNVGGDGPQSNVSLQAAAFEEALNIEINFVSYSGSGPAATGLLGNEVQAAFLTASSALQFVESGRLKALAILSEEGHPSYPDVKTASELTQAEISGVGTAMRGIAAPKGISDEHRQALEKAFKDLMEDEEFQEAAAKVGVVLDYKNSQDFSEALKAAQEETKKYISLTK